MNPYNRPAAHQSPSPITPSPGPNLLPTQPRVPQSFLHPSATWRGAMTMAVIMERYVISQLSRKTLLKCGLTHATCLEPDREPSKGDESQRA